MTAQDWHNCAILFELGLCDVYKRPVFIEARDQEDGRRLWILKMERSQGWVLGKDAEWHYEPLPSNRSKEFINNTRFASPDEVYAFWIENIKEKKPLFLE